MSCEATQRKEARKEEMLTEYLYLKLLSHQMEDIEAAEAMKVQFYLIGLRIKYERLSKRISIEDALRTLLYRKFREIYVERERNGGAV
jgi:hypothetical protein